MIWSSLAHWRRVAVMAALVGGLAASQVAAAASAPEVWSIWERQVAQNAATIDHSAWQQFLDQYLVAQPGAVNRLSYQRVTPGSRQHLQAYLAALSRIDPRNYRRAEQFAYWINLYNALTVELVLRYPAKHSILRMGRRLLSFGPWDDELISVAGEPITLNDIEHRILRPIFRDHRVHYAVNCASISCPNLAPSAYTSDNIEPLLVSGELSYINHERGVRFDSRGRLVLSQIYEWYAEDFASDTPGLLAYLSRHHRTAAEALATYDGRITYAYDWALNGLNGAVR